MLPCLASLIKERWAILKKESFKMSNTCLLESVSWKNMFYWFSVFLIFRKWRILFDAFKHLPSSYTSFIKKYLPETLFNIECTWLSDTKEPICLSFPSLVKWKWCTHSRICSKNKNKACNYLVIFYRPLKQSQIKYYI